MQQKIDNKNVISLIPSENILLKSAYKAYNDDFFNRYYFQPEGGIDNFPGKNYLKEIEEKTIGLLKNELGTQYVDISTISGINCMQTVLYSYVTTGSIVYTISPKHGGHFITEKIIIKLGARVKYIPFIKKTFTIDYQKFAEELKNTTNCSLIYIDQMTGIYPISLLKLNKFFDSSNIIKYYDVSHNFAFIVSGLHTNPLLNGYDAFGGSTHKTIPGPHKGIFTTSNINIFKKFKDNVEITVSHKHYSDILALGIVFEELDGQWLEYTKTIIKNVNTFAQLLDKEIYTIHYGNSYYSKNHQLLIFSNTNNLQNIFNSLSSIGIYVNYIPLPFLGKMGLRLGFQEITFLGACKKDILELSKIFNNILNSDLEILKNKVKLLKNSII